MVSGAAGDFIEDDDGQAYAESSEEDDWESGAQRPAPVAAPEASKKRKGAAGKGALAGTLACTARAARHQDGCTSGLAGSLVGAAACASWDAAGPAIN